MSSKVDWKQKYKELRSKYMNAVDVSYRLGYEQGQKDAEMEMMQMQLQEAQAAAEAAAMGGEEMVDENGMPIAPEEGGEEMPPEVPQEGGEAGDELGQSIDELESYVKHEEDLVTQMGKIHGMPKETEKPEINTSINMEKREQLDSMFKKWEEEGKKVEKKEDEK